MKITKTNTAPGRWGLNEMDVFQLNAFLFSLDVSIGK
jgi:hypothetical protein